MSEDQTAGVGLGTAEVKDDLPSSEEVTFEPMPPSCSKDLEYLGYRGRYAFHRCACCDRVYAVDIEDNTKQFDVDNRGLVLRDTKNHAEIICRGTVRVRR